MRKPTIRPTEWTDLSDLRRLWADERVMTWVGFPDGMPLGQHQLNDWFTRISQSERSHHFVVIADGEFCGEVFYRVDDPPITASLDIKLLPAAQGRGLATAALEELIQLVARSEPSVAEVWTEPWPRNTRAQRLYARCGLRPKRRPAHLDPGPTYWAADLRRT